jgi:hypothetical protein
MALPQYSTGTVSVAAGGTVVTCLGGMWSGINAKQGDFISIDGLDEVLITEVTDATQLKIAPWQGAAKTSVPYVIYQNYVGRVVGVAAAEDVGDMLEKLHVDGLPFILGVDETVPDPSYGDDGQLAFDPLTGQWWVKQGGVWVPSSGLTALGYGGTSATSVTIGLSPPPKVFTTQSSLAYNGARVRAASAANLNNWMEGVATYSATTLTMTVDTIGGVGTYADWLFSVAGAKGGPGPVGPVGPAGPEGPPGATGSGSGNVTGPAGAVNERIAVYNGTSGTVIKDGGKTIAELLAEGGSNVSTSSSPPSGASDGDLWWDDATGNMYVYYNDGTSSQWVSAHKGSGTFSVADFGAAGDGVTNDRAAFQAAIDAASAATSGRVVIPRAAYAILGNITLAAHTELWFEPGCVINYGGPAGMGGSALFNAHGAGLLRATAVASDLPIGIDYIAVANNTGFTVGSDRSGDPVYITAGIDQYQYTWGGYAVALQDTNVVYFNFSHPRNHALSKSTVSLQQRQQIDGIRITGNGLVIDGTNAGVDVQASCIRLVDCKNCVVNGVSVYNFQTSGGYDGIVMAQWGLNNRFEDITIQHSGSYYPYDVFFEHQSHGVWRHIRSSKSLGMGPALRASSYCHIEDIHITGASRRGLSVLGISGCFVDGITLNGNSYTGLAIAYGCMHNHFVNMQCHGNYWHGIWFSDESNSYNIISNLSARNNNKAAAGYMAVVTFVTDQYNKILGGQYTGAVSLSATTTTTDFTAV